MPMEVKCKRHNMHMTDNGNFLCNCCNDSVIWNEDYEVEFLDAVAKSKRRFAHDRRPWLNEERIECLTGYIKARNEYESRFCTSEQNMDYMKYAAKLILMLEENDIA